MALLWETIDRLSAAAQAAIRAHVPYTARLEAVSPSLLAARAQWVLKSDYGCEGAEVIIGADVDADAWRDALAHARPGRWVAQRFFGARRDGDGNTVNVGVFVIGGEAAGFFSRLERGATDHRALTAATLVEREGSHG
jgi:hypothetical protein